jgi:hypothetical protein
VLPKGTFAGRNSRVPDWKATRQPREFQKNARRRGHFNPLVDDDGVSRRVPMIVEFEGAYYESLSLAMVRTLIALQTRQFRKSSRLRARALRQQGLRRPRWFKVGPLTSRSTKTRAR